MEKIIYDVQQDEAMRMTGMSRTSLWVRVRAKELDTKQVGKRIFFRRDQLEAIAKNNRRGQIPAAGNEKNTITINDHKQERSS